MVNTGVDIRVHTASAKYNSPKFKAGHHQAARWGAVN